MLGFVLLSCTWYCYDNSSSIGWVIQTKLDFNINLNSSFFAQNTLPHISRTLTHILITFRDKLLKHVGFYNNELQVLALVLVEPQPFCSPN